MTNRFIKALCLLSALSFVATGAEAAVFKCTDAAGEVTIQDRPCGPEIMARNAQDQAGAANAETGHHLLWKVTGPRGTAYLVGSIHFGKPDMYPLPAAMTQAYETSQALVVETNLLNIDAVQMAQTVADKAMFHDGSTLSKTISPETWQELDRVLRKFGASAELMQQQKPWFVSMTLTSLALRSFGFDEGLGVDFHFMQLANNKKPIIQMETMEQQLNFLDGFSYAEQEEMLKETFQDIDKGREFLADTLQAWRAGDGDKIDKLMNDEFRSGNDADEHMYQVLIRDRNLDMTRKLDKLLDRGGTYFVVLGAAHFVGEDGIVELLKAKGYRIQQN